MGAGLSGCGFGSESPIERVRFPLNPTEDPNPSPGRRRTNRSIEGDIQKRRKKKSTSLTSLSPEAVEAVALMSTSSQQLLESLSDKSKHLEHEMSELLTTLNAALEMCSSPNNTTDGNAIDSNNSNNALPTINITAVNENNENNENNDQDDKEEKNLVHLEAALSVHKDKKFIDINKTLAKIRQRKMVKQLVVHWEEATVPLSKAETEGGHLPVLQEPKPARQQEEDDEEDDEEDVPIETEYYERLVDIRESLQEIFESIETLAEIVVADATLSRGSQTL